MGEANIAIKFDGGDATAHAIDMRLYGQSLQGVERIISSGVILLSARRLPKRGERADIIVKAREPRRGSVETPAILQDGAHLLQLGWSLFTAKGDEIVLNWVSFVLKYLAGDKAEAIKHLDALMETQKMHLEAAERADIRRHEEAAAWRAHALQLVDRLAPAGAQAVAPVGPSVRTMLVTTGTAGEALHVDETMADVIRSRGELEVGPLEEIILGTDGFAYHTRSLTVEHPEEAGKFLHATVQDPIFETEPNAYTEAAAKAARIKVMAKAGRKDGKLKRLYIMDFLGEILE